MNIQLTWFLLDLIKEFKKLTILASQDESCDRALQNSDRQDTDYERRSD
jgi:hypothetical protein